MHSQAGGKPDLLRVVCCAVCADGGRLTQCQGGLDAVEAAKLAGARLDACMGQTARAQAIGDLQKNSVRWLCWALSLAQSVDAKIGQRVQGIAVGVVWQRAQLLGGAFALSQRGLQGVIQRATALHNAQDVAHV